MNRIQNTTANNPGKALGAIKPAANVAMSPTEKLLRLCVFLVAGGRAWQYLIWDAPYRSFLWDPDFMSGFVQMLGYKEWRDYANRSDIPIQYIVIVAGLALLLVAVSALVFKSSSKSLRSILYLGFVLLFIHFLAETKDQFYQTGLFLEHTIQLCSPLFLLFYVKKTEPQRLINILKVACAITFIAHAVYALGLIYPRPGTFIDMVINSFGFDEAQSVIFLNIMGVLDILFACLLFLPATETIAIYYMIIWGIVTAIARTYANFDFNFPSDSFLQNLPSTLYRLPHGLIPLVILLLIKNRRFYIN